MKEASGELSMTLIVIIAAGVILAIFLAFRAPITNAISNKWGDFFSKGNTAEDAIPDDITIGGGGSTVGGGITVEGK